MLIKMGVRMIVFKPTPCEDNSTEPFCQIFLRLENTLEGPYTVPPYRVFKDPCYRLSALMDCPWGYFWLTHLFFNSKPTTGVRDQRALFLCHPTDVNTTGTWTGSGALSSQGEVLKAGAPIILAKR